jgi:hypothetical protein
MLKEFRRYIRAVARKQWALAARIKARNAHDSKFMSLAKMVDVAFEAFGKAT